jgi:hypothetical protein
MSDRLPALAPDDVIRALKKAGGLLRKIIGDTGLTIDEFKALL